MPVCRNVLEDIVRGSFLFSQDGWMLILQSFIVFHLNWAVGQLRQAAVIRNIEFI